MGWPFVKSTPSDVPKGGQGGHGPSLSALRGPLRPRNIFSEQWIKRLLRRKIYIKVSFMYPWLPEGPLMTQWAPAVIRGPLFSWAPGRQGGPRVTRGALREQVAPLLGEILGTCLLYRNKKLMCFFLSSGGSSIEELEAVSHQLLGKKAFIGLLTLLHSFFILRPYSFHVLA